jgi:hypothetical protein
MIAEVLSKSTKGYDRDEKLNLTSIPGQISLGDIYDKVDFTSAES